MRRQIGRRATTRLAVAIAGLAAAASLTACTSASGGTDTLTVGFVVDPSWAQIPVAEQAGYFDDHGVQVEVVQFSTGVEALQALQAGQVDVTTAADVPTAAALATSSSMRVVGDGSRWLRSRIITSRSAGIDDLDDLSGSRIGTPLGTSAAYFAEQTLAAADVHAELVEVDPSAMVTAATQGDVQAVSVFEPYQSQVVQALGKDAVTLDAPGEGYVQHSLYLASEAAMKRKSKALTAFFAALGDAGEDLNQGSVAATQSVATATNLPPGLVKNVLGGFDFGLELQPELADNLTALGQWAKASGELGQAASLPDYGKHLDDRFLGGTQSQTRSSSS